MLNVALLLREFCGDKEKNKTMVSGLWQFYKGIANKCYTIPFNI
jgi:hypothetical protein